LSNALTQAGLCADKLNVGDEQAMRAWFGSPPQTSDGRRRAFEIDASHPLRPNTSASTSSINRERSNESVGAGGGSNDALANIAKMAAVRVGAWFCWYSITVVDYLSRLYVRQLWEMTKNVKHHRPWSWWM